MYLCKKMNMDKKEYYIRMHSNLQYVKKNNCNGDYLCPICLNEYSEQDVKNVLTEEDVPQKSLSGNRIALTCRCLSLKKVDSLNLKQWVVTFFKGKSI